MTPPAQRHRWFAFKLIELYPIPRRITNNFGKRRNSMIRAWPGFYIRPNSLTIIPRPVGEATGIQYLMRNYGKTVPTISDYFEQTHPADVRRLLIEAHHYLQDVLPPFATCGIKWKLPFYTLRRNFCYLNRHPDHITLGFAHGYKLGPRPGVLLDEKGTLKHIRYLEIRGTVELYSETVFAILQEAVILDEMMGQARRGRKPRNRM